MRYLIRRSTRLVEGCETVPGGPMKLIVNQCLECKPDIRKICGPADPAWHLVSAQKKPSKQHAQENDNDPIMFAVATEGRAAPMAMDKLADAMFERMSTSRVRVQ
eukprot:CAMPEP_0119112352 /NCGR_PEP_ID=MMETSP1180-20130426/39902_1 /TAXON_ID=3052 ORGANISM="Chlamydomonas cf sp, Strain CCMP681" /NCGR_SAMPLE_ID=MMETSP1180 /ASSEMBLY_ACC=CAM_ASM_000741 /LENGTH=104 /DNA_ID=CAMNT_0007099819 /DNA_START=300 /DNA_END=615 /DNA_ORIENTATION=+